MGIEKLIPSDFSNHDVNQLSIYTRWDDERTDYTEEEIIIIDDAIETGVITPLPPPVQSNVIVFALVDKPEKGLIVVSILKHPAPTNTEFWSLELDRLSVQMKITFQLCHQVIILPGNPLSLHWRFYAPAEDEKIQIEGIEKCADSAAKATRYTKDLLAYLPRFSNIFKSGRGRPIGSIEPSKADFEKMKRMTIALRKGKAPYTWEYIADKLGIDLKTLTNYRKIWGIK